MTWRVRLAEVDDYPAVRDMARANHAESCPQREWSEDRMKTTFFDDCMAGGHGLIWVAERSGEVVGFLLASVTDYRAFVGHFTIQEVLFVRPDKRGTRAAALLIKKLIDWSRDIGAIEVIGGNDNGVHSEQTARFLSRFGFQHHGYAMRLEINGRR